MQIEHLFMRNSKHHAQQSKHVQQLFTFSSYSFITGIPVCLKHHFSFMQQHPTIHLSFEGVNNVLSEFLTALYNVLLSSSLI